MGGLRLRQHSKFSDLIRAALFLSILVACDGKRTEDLSKISPYSERVGKLFYVCSNESVAVVKDQPHQESAWLDFDGSAEFHRFEMRRRRSELRDGEIILPYGSGIQVRSIFRKRFRHNTSGPGGGPGKYYWGEPIVQARFVNDMGKNFDFLMHYIYIGEVMTSTDPKLCERQEK